MYYQYTASYRALVINKKIAHMSRRWYKPQNFCLAFVDELQKTTIYLKNC